MFLVPFITTVLEKVWHALPFVFLCGIATISGLFTLVLPETLNKLTRERYEDFFDDDSIAESADSQTSSLSGMDNYGVEVGGEEVKKPVETHASFGR